MDIVTVRFTSRWPPNPTSLAIAWLGGSRSFSHSMNIIDGRVYQATMLKGCRAGMPVEQAMSGVALYQDMYVPVPDKAAAIAWGEEQDGKGYDYVGAFGIPLLMSEDWADDAKWWCSEHNFMQLLKGGTALFDPDVFKRITPAHLLMCNFPKSSVVRLR